MPSVCESDTDFIAYLSATVTIDINADDTHRFDEYAGSGGNTNRPDFHWYAREWDLVIKCESKLVLVSVR